MLPQRPKSTIQTGLIKNGGQRPFSILSLGLIGQQKPKASNKVKIHNDKKVKVKDANIKILTDLAKLKGFEESSQ